MVIAEIFYWWYASGWNVFIKKIHGWFSGIIDFFSMGSLIRTLFKPYRQISAETAGTDSSLDLKFHMFLDRLISRIVGFFTRLVLLIVGLFFIIVGGGLCLVLVVIWPLIPFLPIIGISLSIIGVTI